MNARNFCVLARTEFSVTTRNFMNFLLAYHHCSRPLIFSLVT
jgi:hypothetical protein